jgi:folate-binding protein YgfZ
MKNIDNFVTALDDLAVIQISGADAAHFLNGQLTQDVAALAPGRACLAGYCTAKGRLLASMIVWPEAGPDAPRLRALVKADLAQALVKRLSMFVLRAKAKLAVEAAPVVGVTIGAGADSDSGSGVMPDALRQAAQSLDPNAQPYDTVFNELGTWIAAPCATKGLQRWWFVPALGADHGAVPDRQRDWQAADIAAGLPWVEAATQDMFIPQTLNLDLIDGVSFTKGCYPGQEIVARSHYRGTIKRRMARGAIAVPASGADSAAPAQPGVDIFDAQSPDNPCGRIINAARANDGAGEHVLMEVQLADLESADFRLERPEGAAIQLQPLPYEIK